jgi:hypothetical protein
MAKKWEQAVPGGRLAATRPELKEFEDVTIWHIKNALVRIWPGNIVGPEMVARLPRFLMVDDVQSMMNEDNKGGGYRTPGAQDVFDAMVKRGALRPFTDEEDTALVRVLDYMHTRVLGSRKGYEPIREGLARMYPDIEWPPPGATSSQPL